jgi:cytochrome c-type protein NapC
MSEQVQEFLERVSGGFGRIAERLPMILDNPVGYREEAFVLAVIVALLALVIVLVALVLIESIPAWQRRRELGYHRRWDVLALRVAGAILVVVVLAGVASLLPLVPAVGSACSTCHEIAPAVVAWESDAHEGISCYGCHARAGLVGALQAGAQGVARLLGASAADGTGIHIADRRCIACHDEIAEGLTSGQVRMRHSDVIEAGYPCLGCHPNVGHETMERTKLPVVRSRMGTCLGCHDGVAAASECTTCHNGPPSDPETVARTGLTNAPITCTGCHTAETDKRCVDCHGLELPHPGEFMGQHARLSSRSPSLCAKCHETASARLACACHVDVNVHGTYDEWFPRHGPLARTTWPGGCNCHGDSFCLFCHERIP